MSCSNIGKGNRVALFIFTRFLLSRYICVDTHHWHSRSRSHQVANSATPPLHPQSFSIRLHIEVEQSSTPSLMTFSTPVLDVRACPRYQWNEPELEK